MKIAIVAPSPVPFVSGGAEALWSGLYHELVTGSSHDVELLKIPVDERDLPGIVAGYEAFSRLDVSHFDLVVTGKYPAWMVSHPRHVVYMLHPLRGLYDAYHHFAEPTVVDSDIPEVHELLVKAASLHRAALPGFFAALHDLIDLLGPAHRDLRFPGPLARTVVRALDAVALAPSEVCHHLAISRTVARRPDYFPPGVVAGVVHPPSDLEGLHEAEGEYFFTASRHDGPKRLDLLIRAMAHYGGDRRLVIAGSGPMTPALRDMAAGDERIELVGRVSQTELVDHYARSVGVPFIPLDEDLGLITFEALRSGKPVLTTTDSGGPTEFVRPGSTGVVVPPEPEAIGRGLEALEELATRPSTSAAAQASVASVTWRSVARAIVEGRRPTVRGAAHRGENGRPRLVVTSTFPIDPPRNGGQLRAYHLYGGLARWFDIDVVCMAPHGRPPSVRTLANGVVERVIPRTSAHEHREAQITAEVGVPVTDIVAAELADLTPEYARTLEQTLHGAAGVILADPFLHPVVAAVTDLPVIYDAYNCELVLKTQTLPSSGTADRLLASVREIEGGASRAAGLIMTTSREDRAQLHDLYGVPGDRFADAPNGVDLTTVPYTPMSLRARRRERWFAALRRHGMCSGAQRLAVFVGSWHPPNLLAAEAILEMAPTLPHVAFALVGSHTAALRRLPLPSNVIPLGVVPDASKVALLSAADVALAPLTTGSGTNLKVVEYLAAGIPVVSTAVGARGLDLPPHAMRIAELIDFPEAIRGALAADASSDRVTLEARAAVERAYGWPSIAGAVRHPIARVLGLQLASVG